MSFKTKDSISISESTAILEWQIINAYKIKIEGVGTFYNNHGSTIIKTNFKSKTFKLLAFGYNQTIEKEIVIKTIPFTANLKHDAQLKKQANYNVIVKRLTYLKNIDLIEKNLFIKTQKTINFQRLTNENDIVNQIQNIDTSINFN